MQKHSLNDTGLAKSELSQPDLSKVKFKDLFTGNFGAKSNNAQTESDKTFEEGITFIK